MQGPIGIFDSGFGGLHILRGVVRALPAYDYVYLGDTARVPYGTRSSKIVYEFTRQAIDFLFGHGCQLVVIACNTASSEALRKIQREHVPRKWHGKKVLGVLIPAAEEAVAVSKNKRVGVIGTEGTVRSKAFVQEIQKIDPRVRVFQHAAPLLVPIVESGEQKTEATRLVLAAYLSPLLRKRIDTLILGCTHYGLLESSIRRIVGPSISIVSEADVVGRKLGEYLRRHPEVEKRITKDSGVQFYSTDLAEKFDRLGSRFFGKEVRGRRAIL